MTSHERGEELLGEQETLQRKLTAATIANRNRAAADAAHQSVEERRARLSALRVRREALAAELAALEQQQAELVATAQAERPDLPSELVWETRAAWTYLRRHEELSATLVAIDEEVKSLEQLEEAAECVALNAGGEEKEK